MPKMKKNEAKNVECRERSECSGAPWKKICLAAAIVTVIAYAVHSVGAFLTMDYYANPAYYPLWSTLMMPGRGPPGLDFFAFSLAFSFIGAALYGFAYSLLRRALPDEGMRKGLAFGALLFLIAGVPSTLSMYLLFAVPAGLIAAWTVEAFVVFLVTGVVIQKIVK